MTDREKLMIKKYLECNVDSYACLPWNLKKSCDRYCQKDILYRMIFNYCRRYHKIFVHDKDKEPTFLDKDTTFIFFYDENKKENK